MHSGIFRRLFESIFKMALLVLLSPLFCLLAALYLYLHPNRIEGAL